MMRIGEARQFSSFFLELIRKNVRMLFRRFVDSGPGAYEQLADSLLSQRSNSCESLAGALEEEELCDLLANTNSCCEHLSVRLRGKACVGLKTRG
jgi:hypothetical protein|tara:strand:- start:1416 stop:1700 length:285 start_codon:yes stop_codon:yes gene_type:complete